MASTNLGSKKLHQQQREKKPWTCLEQFDYGAPECIVVKTFCSILQKRETFVPVSCVSKNVGALSGFSSSASAKESPFIKTLE